MSTRCQIAVYDSTDSKPDKWKALIYRHSDGYPGKVDGSEYGVLADIVPFVKAFHKVRGPDAEYLAARLLQFLCHDYDCNGEELAKELKNYQPRDVHVEGKVGTGTLGYGISSALHGDIEYFYSIYPDRVEVREVTYSSGHDFRREPLRSWPIIKTIPLS